MYFLPRNSTLYAAMAHTRPFYRYVGTLFFVSFLGYGAYDWIYAPLDARITQYEHDNQHMREQVMQATKEQVEHDRRQSSIKELKEKVQSYGGSSTQALLADFMNRAHTHRCNVTQCHVEQERDKQWYTKQRLVVDITGDLASLSAFLAKKDPAMHARCSSVRLVHDAHATYTMSCVFNSLLLRPN
jgi:hypothetical protein